MDHAERIQILRDMREEEMQIAIEDGQRALREQQARRVAEQAPENG